MIKTPYSTTLPPRSTTMLSAFFTVDKRWAMTMSVRPRNSRLMFSVMRDTLLASSDEVASSSIRYRGRYIACGCSIDSVFY